MTLAELIKKEGDIKVFEYKGFECYVMRNPVFLNLNGYVRIPETHPLYKVNYYDFTYDLDIHGGLSYSESFLLQNGYDTGWYIGFDCAHFGDYLPNFNYVFQDYECDELVYRTMEYVENELKRLVDQLIQIEEEH